MIFAQALSLVSHSSICSFMSASFISFPEASRAVSSLDHVQEAEAAAVRSERAAETAAECSRVAAPTIPGSCAFWISCEVDEDRPMTEAEIRARGCGQ